MSRSTFLQGMAGDPLSLPVEYQDLVIKMNSHQEVEVANITEDRGNEGNNGRYPMFSILSDVQMEEEVSGVPSQRFSSPLSPIFST